MLVCLRIARETSLGIPVTRLPPFRNQQLSTIAAIRHGVRKSTEERSPPTRHLKRGEDNWVRDRRDRVDFQSFGYGNAKNNERNERGVRTSAEKERESARAIKKQHLEIPYSTAASEFLYGTSTVLAALKGGRRRLYKLYLLEESERNTRQNAPFQKYAALRGARVILVKPEQTPSLDRASKSRPHNGVILEASPLAKLPIQSLLPVHQSMQSFSVEPSPQSEEEKLINGHDTTIGLSSSWNRYPFVIMLDGILDPGNLGAILRTAFFLGADAVVVSTQNAPLSPVALKASAGASESLPLLSVHSTGPFVQASKANGWKFYAGVAPVSSDQGIPKQTQKHFFTTSLGSPLEDNPCVLMLGGEGSGLKADLVRKADYLVSITGERSARGGVDSLNVSVATGVLCEAFLRQPRNTPQRELF